MKRTALALLTALALAGCGGGSAEEVSAPAEVEAPKEKPSPKPTKAKNPLDTSDNRLACSTSRREVGERADIFSDVAEGTALPEDGAKAAKELQKDVGDAGSYATGAIQVELLKLSDAYGRMRVGLATGDLESLSQGVKEQNASLGELDTLCTSIGE